MKKTVIFCLLLFLTINVFSQQKISTEQKQIDDIYLRMDMHYEQYKTGTIFIIVGIMVNTAVSLTVLPNLEYDDDSYANLGKIGYPIGSALMTAGWIIQMNSHKYFRKNYKKRKPIY